MPPASVDEFLSVAVHDLRNPLSVIRASAQMVTRQIDRGTPEAARPRLQAIVEQTDRLSEVLEAFLDAARIEAGSLQLRHDPTDLRELIPAMVERARSLTGARPDRQVDLDLADDLVGQWDHVRVGRAVRALLENAFLYGDPGGSIHVSAVRQGDRAVVSIRDGGPGPRAEEEHRLFQRFFRGYSAAEAGHAGSGLGLFTARGIARAHGGQVRYSGDSTFELTLPLS